MFFRSNVENLTLTGTANISAQGNDFNNVIVGNSGDNFITDTLGNDTFTGGAGSDNFIFGNAPYYYTNLDGTTFHPAGGGMGGSAVITDFTSGVDKIYLGIGQFANIIPQINVEGDNLLPSHFISGAGLTAQTNVNTAEMIYDTSSGSLYYQDGYGNNDAILVATLTGAPNLQEADLFGYGLQF